MSNLVYGIVVGGKFYSGRMTRGIRSGVCNGIYSMDMSADDFESTLAPADLADAAKYFRKASRLEVVSGISFQDGMVPNNPVAYPNVPVKVNDPTYGDFEEVEAVLVRPSGFYFLRTVQTDRAYVLMDLKARLESDAKDKWKGFEATPDLTPAMRVACLLHVVDAHKKAKLEPEAAIRAMMAEVGASVEKIVVDNLGYLVSWGFERHKFVTRLDKELKVVKAGYCVAGNDRKLSVTSMVNILKDGIRDKVSIHTMAVDDEADFDQDDD